MVVCALTVDAIPSCSSFGRFFSFSFDFYGQLNFKRLQKIDRKLTILVVNKLLK